MQIDATTLDDLSIFNSDETQSVFHKLNYTRTDIGKRWLKHFFSHPFNDLSVIEQTQKILQRITRCCREWPMEISNGTIMVLDKFYDTAISDIPQNTGYITAMVYKLLHGSDFSIIKYTVGHSLSFLNGLERTVALLEEEPIPEILRRITERINYLVSSTAIQNVLRKKKELGNSEVLQFAFFLRYRFKSQLMELMDLYGRLDAYYSMSVAGSRYNFHFPCFLQTDQPKLYIDKLYHILLSQPVPYSLKMDRSVNFTFLTGANMAGKSTFIRAVGLAVYLAHLGMGVPAQKMELGLFQGILSNIQVNDNILRGESYFYNEVQRIKNTILKINNGKKWLVLIDELFKGTNVEDAMKCSLEVVQGLIKMHTSLFIFSTHLYEIGAALKNCSNISFRYFETTVSDDQLLFSYQLKAGISNDRLGYLILKKEGVVALLHGL